MLVVRVYGMPEKFSQQNFKDLNEDIKKRIASIGELKISIAEVSVFFPSDRMREGLGEEIIAFVDGLSVTQEKRTSVRNCVASSVCGSVRKYLIGPEVECFVTPFDPGDGFGSLSPNV